ncbi:MAG TPA: Type 1 glutamine amidotransferase-like domain-containing protein [Polyangiaceae bacterium]
MTHAFLIAGAGPGTGPRSLRFHKDVVRATGKAKPVYAYVGAASDDSLMFEKMLKGVMFGLGSKVLSVRLSKAKTKTSEAKAMLADADVVFISGGDVERGMQLIGERDLGGYFHELAGAGKIFEAVSAGSIMLGEHWVRFPDGEDHKAEVFDCMGIVPMSFDAHDEASEWEELRVLAKKLPAKAAKAVYGLTSGTAAAWDGKKLRALGGPVARYSCGAGSKRLEDLDPDR